VKKNGKPAGCANFSPGNQTGVIGSLHSMTEPVS
jgi:hypothetical protein